MGRDDVVSAPVCCVLTCQAAIVNTPGTPPSTHAAELDFFNFKEPKNRFQGTNSARLCSLAGRYDNAIPRFLAPIGCSKIPALGLYTQLRKKEQPAGDQGEEELYKYHTKNFHTIYFHASYLIVKAL
jgi:hypothetical protein